MVGEACQLDVHRRAVGSTGKGDPQDLGRSDGIITKGLVEVTDPKE